MLGGLPVSDLFKEFLNNLDNLTEEQVTELLSRIDVKYPNIQKEGNIVKDDKAKEIVCTHCNSSNIRKHGFKNGRQRYYCKDCHKTFVSSTGSITYHSRLTPEQWRELIRGVVENLSLSKIAKNIGTTVPTAWYNKQKICKALIEAYGMQDKFIDIAECDEYYTTLSFKGKRDPSFFINTLNRLPRHHRTYEEKVEYLMKNGFWAELQDDPERLAMLLGSTDSYLRGISNDQTCILTCKDRNENLYVNPVSIGRLETADIKKHLSGRFAPDAIMVTDSHVSYPSFAKSEHIQLEQIESGKHSKGAYNLGRVNAVHSKLSKYWPREEERAPATKYLDLNLILFWWLEKNDKLSTQEKVEAIYKLITSNTGINDTSYKAITNRELTINTKGRIPKKV